MSVYAGKEQDPEAYERFRAFCVERAGAGQAARTSGKTKLGEARRIADRYDRPDPVTNLDHAGQALVRYLREAERDSAIDDAYAAILQLAGDAAAIRDEVRAVELHEQHALQSLGNHLVEVRDKVHAKVFADNEDAIYARAAEEDRIRTQASERRQRALDAWYAACRRTAEVLVHSTNSLNDVPECPAALQPHERSSPQAAREDLNRTYAGLLALDIKALGDDPAALEAYWDSLPDDRRQALLASAPGLVKTRFWAFLTNNERDAFHDMHPFTARETDWTLEAKAEVDALVAGLGGSVKLSVKTAESSDEGFDVTFELKAEGEGEFLVWLASRQRTLAYTVRFPDKATYEAYRVRLEAAWAQDRDGRDLALPLTRAVLAESFSREGNGWTVDDHVLAGVGKDFGSGAAALTARFGLGTFHDEVKQEKGVYTRANGKAEGRVPGGSAEGQLSHEVRFLYDKDERPYVEVKGELETWLAAHLPPSIELPGGIPEGGTAIVTVTARMPVTTETQPLITTYLHNVANGHTDALDLIEMPTTMRALLDRSDMILSVKVGTVDKTDSNSQGAHANITVKELETKYAVRKPIGDTAYTQTDP